MGNIVGLDLNIDKDYLADAVKQTVLMGISESLNGKNEIVSQVVGMTLSTKVDRNGKISSYERNNTQTLLEFYVKKMIMEVTQEELETLVEAHREDITKAIKVELNKKANINKFVDRFIDSISDAISNTWVPKIEVSFDKSQE